MVINRQEASEEVKMHFHIVTVLLIILDHINKIFTQGMPVSPCPKQFQYRFDGAEWFGLLSVRNPDFGETLHLRVILSMRGKPTTNYLGEIELLTRGQFGSDTPILYRIKFPMSNFPPKLLQIKTNHQVVCVGGAEHGIFITQIQLEHTRKLTFAADDATTWPLPPGFALPPAPQPPPPPPPGGVSNLKRRPPSAGMGFSTKHLPFSVTDKNPLRAPKDTCGKIDDRIRFQVLHAVRAGSAKQRGSGSGSSDTLSAAGRLLQRSIGRGGVDSGDGASSSHAAATAPLVPAATILSDYDDEANSDGDGDGAAAGVVESPSITRGAWPWLAAIYVNNLTSLSYQCGGTLVSARIVISSAHCFHSFKQRYTANEVLVFLGRHNLKNWNEEGSMAAPVDDIFIHPDYDSHLNTYDADIAVVVLKNDVRFSTFIRPACMWSGSAKPQYIEGEHGVVVGWSLGDANGSASRTTVPKIIDAPIVSNVDCFKANNKFRSLSSNRTFCAGVVAATAGNVSESSATLATGTAAPAPAKRRRVQSGPCSGDSGAGLMILKNNRWMLRGIVSASLPIVPNNREGSPPPPPPPPIRSRCNVNQYVIYTDAAKFLDWIFAFIL